MLHRLAWEQLVVEKRRLVAALAGIGFAVMLQLMQLGIRDALFDSAVLLHNRLLADLVLTSPLYQNELAAGVVPRRRLYQGLTEPSIESITPLYMGVGPLKNPETGREMGINIIGFRPDSLPLNIPSAADKIHLLKIPDVAIIDRYSRPEFGPIPQLLQTHPTVTTEVLGRRTRIAGVFELGLSFAGNGYLMVSDETFRKQFRRPEGIFSLGLIRLKPGSDIAAVQGSLRRRLPDDVQVLTMPEFIELEKTFWRNNTPIGPIFLMGAFIGLLVGAVIVYQILYTDVSDHLAEYATLKAMGYADRQLYGVVIEQALILSVLGFPIGFALAEVLYTGARTAARLPIEMSVARAVMVFGFTLLMGIVSGFIALRRVQSADPAEVF
jgi:putative ABC transport system permease protein